MLDEAFEALRKYDWGSDRALVDPIEAAAVSAQASPEDRRNLEDRLLDALQSNISRDAKDYVCRMLKIVGRKASVPVLAGLLAEKNHAHMARFALQSISASEAGQALQEALPKLSGNLKIGVISSIGARRDGSGVPALAGLLADSDSAIAQAAAMALGSIGSAQAAEALQAAKTSAEVKPAVIDARLACAEALLAENQTAAARAIYQSLSGTAQAKLVRLAATRGMLACAAKTA